MHRYLYSLPRQPEFPWQILLIFILFFYYGGHAATLLVYFIFWGARVEDRTRGCLTAAQRATCGLHCHPVWATSPPFCGLLRHPFVGYVATLLWATSPSAVFYWHRIVVHTPPLSHSIYSLLLYDVDIYMLVIFSSDLNM